MAENHVTIVFDRKKKAEETSTGKIELQNRLTRTCRKYITVDECTPKEWRTRKFSENVIAEQIRIEKIVSAMECLGEDMTMENLNKHLGLQTIKREPRKKPIIKVKQKKNPLKESFLDFMRDEIIKERSKDSTKRQKMVALDALERWGKIKTFGDLTPAKLREWDEWLRADGTRSDPAVHNYHKQTKPYVRLAYERGIIEKEPYSMCHFPRGKCKERRPLSERELKLIREAELPAIEANRMLDNMRVSINKHYREIMDRDKSESLIIKEFGLRFCAILSFTGQQ